MLVSRAFKRGLLLMKRFVAVVTAVMVLGASTTGCYNTYSVSKEEFEKLQRKPDDSEVVTVTDDEGVAVGVGRDTKLFVRSDGGRRYPVTPFNFKVTQSQLVASDRDTLLAVDGLAAYEIDHLSTWQTVGLVSLGALAAAGVIVAIIVTSGSKTLSNE
jgi:hypothetical protein